MKKIKAWRDEAREKKRVHSDDLERIIQRCRKKFEHLFPDYRCTKKGSKSVHHFNVPGVAPISIERPHGNREYIPRTYAAIILDGIDDLVHYIEMHSKDELYEHDIDDTDSSGEDQNGEGDESP